jgi:hypothetical protein
MNHLLFPLLSLLALAAVFAAGLPLRGPRPDDWWKLAVDRDQELLTRLGWITAVIAALFLLGLLDGFGGWLLLVVVVAVGTPVALDRLRHTRP